MRPLGLHLNALRAFEAAGRLSSFSRAAEELNVSHSTISHHVKGLEKTLGMDLFVRRNRRVVLTGAGETLLPVLENAFDSISSTLATLRDSGQERTLKVTVTPSFANKWLMPRLRHFREVCPGIEVQLESSLALAEFSRLGLNAGVRAGWGRWPGLRSEPLMPIHLTPVCSPALLEGRRHLADPRALRDFTLIHADVSDRIGFVSEWHEWLFAVGVDDVDCTHGLSFHDPGLALQAAIDGLGIAMGYVELAEIDLAEGRLVRPFAEEIRHPWSYYIVVPENIAEDIPARMFCDWLRAEVAASGVARASG